MAHPRIGDQVKALVARRLEVGIERVSNRQVKEGIGGTSGENFQRRPVYQNVQERVGVGWEARVIKGHVDHKLEAVDRRPELIEGQL